jgi:hypothetical protein
VKAKVFLSEVDLREAVVEWLHRYSSISCNDWEVEFTENGVGEIEAEASGSLVDRRPRDRDG